MFFYTLNNPGINLFYTVNIDLFQALLTTGTLLNSPIKVYSVNTLMVFIRIFYGISYNMDYLVKTGKYGSINITDKKQWDNVLLNMYQTHSHYKKTQLLMVKLVKLFNFLFGQHNSVEFYCRKIGIGNRNYIIVFYCANTHNSSSMCLWYYCKGYFRNPQTCVQ